MKNEYIMIAAIHAVVAMLIGIINLFFDTKGVLKMQLYYKYYQIQIINNKLTSFLDKVVHL